MTDQQKSAEYDPARLSIRDWAVADRPREKYVACGRGAVSDSELIAILLHSGTQKCTALDLAKKLLAACDNSLNRLSEMSVEELMSINGIGQAKAVTLHAAFELGRRRRSEAVVKQKKVLCTQDVVELMQSKIADLKHEEFWALYLNAASEVLRVYRIGQGGLSSTIVDVQRLIKMGIDLRSSHILLCHNHPSGRLKPSENDIALTEQVCQASRLFNIALVDHVIVSGNNGFSFLAEGLL